MHQITVIFIGILAGFVCRKAKILTEESTSTVSNIVVRVILPFYLFSAILNSGTGIETRSVFLMLSLSFGMFLISALAGLILVRLLRVPQEDRGVYLFETMCGNVTYIGISVCTAVLGSEAAFYASLLNIPYNLLCFSLGVWLAVLYVLHVPVPAVILDGCAFIGQATSPCAMLVIGSVLASVPFKEIFTEWLAFPYAVVRLVGLGALMAFLLSFLDVDPLMKGVLILMSSMPAATNSTMLCTIYGGNRALSAKLIFLSTALSIVTIPLWASLWFA